MQPDGAGFTGITTPDGPDTTLLESIASSLASEFSQTTGTRTGAPSSSAATFTSVSESASAFAPASASESPSAAPTSAISSTTFTTSVTSAASSISDTHASTTATNAASSTNGAVTVSHSKCDSISCSSALKAAVAVPLVVAALVGLFLFLFFARRRKKRTRGDGAAVSEKKAKKAGKKWSRHLRAFSFDAELLMGGRFSSTNSIRSRDPSVRSGANASQTAAQSAEPSLHSIEEEVAPPYRDAISHGHTPASPRHPRSPVPITSVTTDPIPRPASTATAPPPYGSVVGETRHQEPPTPASATDPFADSAPVSPIDDSPFNDPPDARPGISRNSSLYQHGSADDLSEAASIREAQVGRRVSARATDNTGGGGN
ncbi:hypothetical protein HRR83_002693 [Exophiala dermatitidis]|uniref:Uncharacterized protein n=2 Tax=Exophiala dermatitidis TaxID=5970 RepID=H6C0A5_EXODN